MSAAFSRSVRSACAIAVPLSLLGACSGDGPQVPTTFTPTASTQVSALVGSTLSSVPSVTIADAKGRAVEGVLVRWKVRAGGGHVVNDTVRTRASGEGTSGGWALGGLAGVQMLQATVDGLAPITFTAVAAPGPAAMLVSLSSDAQRATVNTAVAAPPSVRVEDSFGNALAGVPVTFSAASGSGVIVGTEDVTNAAGIASAVSWTLGTTSGPHFARATVAHTLQATIVATAVAGTPVTLVRLGIDNQQGVSNAPIAEPPGVRVSDQYGNPVGDVPVSFRTRPGSGSVSTDLVATDPATGTAFVRNWTLGTATQQTLIATSAMLPDKSVTFRASVVASSFDIDVRFIGDGGTPQQRNAFIRAAAKWRRVIVGDVHTMRVSEVAGYCDTWIPAIDETINDVVIFARIRSIDGVGRTLAQAGPCSYSTVSNLTLYGLMEFDEDDLPGMIANSTLDDVALHEMGHVLGIGTLWSFRRDLLVDRGGADPYFVGARARAEFAAVSGLTYAGLSVPVENSGGAGTRDAHWRASVLGRELMQGYARAGGMPLSRLTAASLADLGYSVVLSSADPFSLTTSLRSAAEVLVPLGDDVADLPLKGVGPDGSSTLVRPGTVKRP